MLERLLSIAGGDDEATWEPRLRALRLAIPMLAASELLLAARIAGPAHAGEFTGAAVLLAACIGLLSFGRWERIAVGSAFAILLVEYARLLPATANHQFVALLCLALFALFDPSRANERALLMCGLRWVTVILFFYTGLKKLFYGLYVWQGEYFAYAIANDRHLSYFFEAIAPAAEVARLRALAGIAEGAGPYTLEFPPLLLAANATVAAELALPVLLLVRRTRVPALAASLALIVVIQVGAREFVFGLLFTGLALLFARRDLHTPLSPVFLLALVVLLAIRYFVAPDWRFA